MEEYKLGGDRGDHSAQCFGVGFPYGRWKGANGRQDVRREPPHVAIPSARIQHFGRTLPRAGEDGHAIPALDEALYQDTARVPGAADDRDACRLPVDLGVQWGEEPLALEAVDEVLGRNARHLSPGLYAGAGDVRDDDAVVQR